MWNLKTNLKELGGLDSGVLFVDEGNRCRWSSRGVLGRRVSKVRSDDLAALMIWELVGVFSGKA